MKVIVADSAGFCYGVRRALDTVLEAAQGHEKPMYTLGPLIHNPQVIERLRAAGVEPVMSLEEIPAGSIVIMPSHGVPHDVMVQARSAGLEIVDVTCPFVGKVHRLAESLVKDGYQIIVLGDKGHTEVRGIMSVCGADAVAVSEVGELAEHELKTRVGILSQTTQTVERFQELVAYVSGHAYEIRAYNTICNATMERQHAALALAGNVDVIVVVGGRNSANTKRLAQICSETGVSTYHVEVAGEIDDAWFAGKTQVGVTAGASTPDWVISEVVERIKRVN